MNQSEQTAKAFELIETAQLRMVTRDNLRYWNDTTKRKLVADYSIPTACTNGERIRFNPAFICSLTLGEIIFLLAHEVSHIKCLHHLRMTDKDPMIRNQACDYLVNDMLQAEAAAQRRQQVMDPLVVIKGALLNPQYSHRKVTEEVLCDLLEKEQPEPQQPPPPEDGDGDDQQDGDGDQDGAGGQGDQDSDDSEASDGSQSDDQDGEGQDQGQGQSGQSGQSGATFDGDIVQVEAPDGWDDKSDEEKAEEIAEAERQVRKDNAIHTAAGSMPASFKEHFDLTAAPLKNWKQVIADFAYTSCYSEYDDMQYDRRLVQNNVYLPDLGGEEIDCAGIYIDVSGSVDKQQLERFLTEANDVLMNGNCQEAYVLQVNTRVMQVDQYMEGDQISPKVNGGGGTSFVPPFEWMEEQAIDPDFAMYFTDGECDTFPEEPDYPVLWVLFAEPRWHNWEPPFGETVVMDEV